MCTPFRTFVSFLESPDISHGTILRWYLSPHMDWFILWETVCPTKNPHCKESISSLCYHNWSAPQTHPSPILLCVCVCCCAKLWLMRRVDVSLSWECIVKRIMTAPDEPLSSFFSLCMFLTPTILVFTQLESNESVSADWGFWGRNEKSESSSLLGVLDKSTTYCSHFTFSGAGGGRWRRRWWRDGEVDV